jgi:malic enzyme
MYIFPGVGLGAVVSQAKKLSDGLFIAAARTLASCVTEEELERGQIFPSLYFIRSISTFVANSVCQEAVKEVISAEISATHTNREYQKLRREKEIGPGKFKNSCGILDINMMISLGIILYSIWVWGCL